MCIYILTYSAILYIYITFVSGYSYMVPHVYQFLVLRFAETAVLGETSGLVSVTRETKKKRCHSTTAHVV